MARPRMHDLELAENQRGERGVVLSLLHDSTADNVIATADRRFTRTEIRKDRTCNPGWWSPP